MAVLKQRLGSGQFFWISSNVFISLVLTSFMCLLSSSCSSLPWYESAMTGIMGFDRNV